MGWTSDQHIAMMEEEPEKEQEFYDGPYSDCCGVPIHNGLCVKCKEHA